MQKICLIGKFPPIQGGVSRDTYWMARALAQCGIETHVVTNAEVVEQGYRLNAFECLARHEPSPLPNLFIHNVKGAPRHIPWSPAYVTSLAGRAAAVVNHEQCDLILAYYFEPYLLAAELASAWTSTPFGVRHSGSDIGRLMRDPDLRNSYAHALSQASFVLSSRTAYRSLISIGVPHSRLFAAVPGAVPQSLFTHTGPVLPIDKLLEEFADQEASKASEFRFLRELAKKPWRSGFPTIGIYGKIGDSKGTFNLIEVLGRIRRRGVQFNFVAMISGRQDLLDRFGQAVEDAGLSGCTWQLPSVFPWAVPLFIRLCTAVCFLERNFEVEGHAPIIPREVFSCGICLILSQQIASNSGYSDVVDRHNAFVVDPLVSDRLEEVISAVCADPEIAHRVGRNGWSDLACGQETIEDYQMAIAERFAQVEDHINGEASEMSLAEAQACLARLSVDETFRKTTAQDPSQFTALYSLSDDERSALEKLDRALLERFAKLVADKRYRAVKVVLPLVTRAREELIQQLWRRFRSLQPSRPFEPSTLYAEQFGSYLIQTLDQNDPEQGMLAELARYELIHFKMAIAPARLPRTPEAYLPVDHNENSTFHIVEGVTIAEFSVDVGSLANSISRNEGLVCERRRTCLVFCINHDGAEPTIFGVSSRAYRMLEVIRDRGGLPFRELSSDLSVAPEYAAKFLNSIVIRGIIRVTPANTL